MPNHDIPATTTSSSTAVTDERPTTPSVPILRERILTAPRAFRPDDDPIAWLAHFEAIVYGNHWVNQGKLKAVGVYLEGTAQTWYEANHHSWTTFAAFKKGFLDRYHTYALMASAGEAAQQYKQDPSQTVEEMIVDMDRLFALARITDDNGKRLYFSAALRPEIRTVVLRQKPDTYEDMCRSAREEGQVLATVEAQDAYHPATRSNILDTLNCRMTAMSVSLMENTKAVKQMQQQSFTPHNIAPRTFTPSPHQQQPRSNNTSLSTRLQQLYNKGRCFNCGEHGHRSNKCLSEKPLPAHSTTANTATSPARFTPVYATRNSRIGPPRVGIDELNYMETTDYWTNNDYNDVDLIDLTDYDDYIDLIDLHAQEPPAILDNNGNDYDYDPDDILAVARSQTHAQTHQHSTLPYDRTPCVDHRFLLQ